VLALGAVFVITFAMPSHAHAVLSTSEPADGATLDRPPTEVLLSFSEPVDTKVSSIRVLDTNGRNVARGSARTLPGDAKKFRIGLSTIGEGVYIISWRVLSTADGHVTGGTLAFGVGVSPEGVDRPPGVVSETPGATPLSVASRVLFYVGVLTIIGAAWITAFAFQGAVALRWVIVAGWGAGLLGTLGLAESQLRETGAGLGDIFGTAIGDALLWRLGAMLVVGIALLLARGSRRQGMLVVAGVAAVAAIVAHVSFGHAAAGSSRWLKVAAQSAHVSAVGVWIGGLGVLLIGIRGAEPGVRARAVRRFSMAAGIALLVVAATGTLRAINETGSWRALTETGFGRVIIAKVSLLVMLAVLGAVNRYRHVKRVPENVSGLRRVSRVEIALAAVVLGLTGVMTSIVPARTAARAGAPAKPRSIVVTGSDFGTTIRARLEIMPGKPGPNRFALELTDYDTGEPVTARRVSLRFTYRGRSDIQPSTIELTRRPDGSYVARGGNVGLGGPWKAAVLVEREATSVEVPLFFATIADFERTEIKTPGQPTLYNVKLPGTGTVQFYVDPPRAGRAEVHATFFSESGGELAGLRDIVLVASPPGGREPVSLGVRVLSTGHFVAGANLRAGRWRFDVTASTQSADVLWVYFEETIAA
jgi:copper transport protein